MNRLAASTWIVAVAFLGFVCLATAPPAAAEEPAKPEVEAAYAKALELGVTKALEAVDLTPPPAFEVPDPPPHEGAMISLPPYVIEPPDLVRVEVLDALERRPISGERLVRPDGKIALGFYGEVDIRGLTIEQARIKIVKHLRNYLLDDVLGLTAIPVPPIVGTPEAGGRDGTAPTPDVAPHEKAPAEVQPQAGPAPAATRRLRKIADSPTERSMRRWQVLSGAPTGYYFRRSLWYEEPSKSHEVDPTKAFPTPASMVLHSSGSVTIRIDSDAAGTSVKPAQAAEPSPKAGEHSEPLALVVDPLFGRDRVFVDVSAYNSKQYFVLGQVPAPGKLPCTGNDTVLDVLQYAGGLLASADPNHIDLVRPGRNGKPPRVYKVDLDAIQTKGETATNYQLFPGDRLYVHPRPAPAEEDDSGSK